MMDGWYAMRRGWLDNPMFAPQGKWSKAEAWIWLVESACYKDTVIDIGGKPYSVSRGSLCFSQRFLATKFKWSKKAVTTFLETLEAHGAIKISVAKTGTGTRSKRTQVTLCNYEKYQQAGTKTEPKRDQKGTKEEQGNNIPVGTGDESPSKSSGSLLWAEAKKVLSDATGKPANSFGGVISKWISQAGETEAFNAIWAARDKGTGDPIGYVNGILRNSRKHSPSSGAQDAGSFGMLPEVG